MLILPPHPDLIRYLKERRLTEKFEKQLLLLRDNWKHPSLNTELLEPKKMMIFSFRVDRRYRALFIFRDTGTIEIIEVSNHYH